MRATMRSSALLTIAGAVTLSSCTPSAPAPAPIQKTIPVGSGKPVTPSPPAAAARWRLVHHETFDAPFAEPSAWVEDTYGDDSPYHVDAFDDDGAFFYDKGGATFRHNFSLFRSFRKSFTHGEGGWLTVESYGRDSDRDGVPETGGRFVSERGKARLVSTRHYDAAILRSTRALPAKYRVEVTVSSIDFGGKRGGSFAYGGKINGYDGDEVADPWRFRDTTTTPLPATTDNGVYFLCITDYARPAPHNNVFIHHHRKVVMDTDNNDAKGSTWSKVWNPLTQQAEEDGHHYMGMFWLQGEKFGSQWVGNEFTSYTTDGWKSGPTFVDKYLDGETYVFSIERDGESYATSITGKFHHGGQRTYRASRRFRESPVTWHYNQTPEEYQPPHFNETMTYQGKTYDTWPPGSSYPDHFFFGDPHINYYEGTVEYDDLKLYLPVEP